MTTPHRIQFQRLLLQIERDLVAQAQLRTLLTAADKAVAEDRQELRAAKARIKRTRH
jgi:hypothetical protein